MRRFFRISALAFCSLAIPYTFQKSIFPISPTNYTKLTPPEIKNFTSQFPRLRILNSNQSVEYLLSHIRDKSVGCFYFRYYSDRVIRILLEESIIFQDLKTEIKESPLGFYEGLEVETPLYNFCAVTILRAGNSFLSELLHLFPGIAIGQVLVQRNEESKEKEPIFYYKKLPKNIGKMKVLLCDPMVATGGSINVTIKSLIESGVKEENITVISLIGCKKGVETIFKEHKNIRMVLGFLDPQMIEDSKYIAPGLGDFGDRYFGAP